MHSRALAWQLWLVKRIGSVERLKSIAFFADSSTIMMRSTLVARMRASATLIDSPRISPIFSRRGMASDAYTPCPSMRLAATSTANFW